MDAAVRQRNLALLAEGEALVENAAAAGLAVRLLGGVAVMHHCPQVRASGGSRTIADLDLMASSGQSRKLSAYLVGRGYQAEARFNALHGQDRMLFHGPLGQLDVLVGTVEMCHRLEMDGRLILETPTLSATDLLLTKLQIVEINHKDVVDAIDLLDAHELGSTEGDVINLTYLGEVTARDWGLWRTIKGTLGSPRAGATRFTDRRKDRSGEERHREFAQVAQVEGASAHGRPKPLVQSPRRSHLIRRS